MRMRNPKNMDEILSSCNYFLTEDLFNNDNDICLEIGMGKGKFIIENALKYPDINFIGIEKYDSVVAKSLPKIPVGLSNLYVIRMED